MWLDDIVSKIDEVRLEIDLLGGGYTFYNIPASAYLVQDIHADGYYGLIKVNFTVPNDFPSWNNIGLYTSYLIIRNSQSGMGFAFFDFKFFENMGTQLLPGQSVTLFISILPLTFLSQE